MSGNIINDNVTAASVGSDSLLGARPRPRRRPSILIGAMLAAAMVGGGLPRGLMSAPREPREKTPDDLLRLAMAQDKRERKRLMKEAAKTKAPNT